GIEVSLKLVQDLPLNGRILDQNRRPVADAKIRVNSVLSGSKAWSGSLPGQPAVLTTDSDGRFRVTGLGRDRIVRLALEGPAIQDTILAAATRATAATPDVGGINGATFEYRALPSQSIRGVVRDKATGRPVAGVGVCAFQHHPPTFTDKDGRFEILGCPK